MPNCHPEICKALKIYCIICQEIADLSKVVFPQLTSVEPPMFEMGRTAAQMLIEQGLDPATPVRTVVLNAEINLRGSTGKK